MHLPFLAPLLCLVAATELLAQSAAYRNPPPADPPYYRVRYEASEQPGELIFPVTFTLWIPPDTDTLRGIVVHQHGCGEGSCRSGQTGAFDRHWQALASEHDCALLSPSYEQPDGTDCQRWCDPRNGSGQQFRKSLVDLGKKSGHPELASVPWALWGHSGGGHWAGGMLMLHPERVVAAWLRSGVPLLEDSDRPGIEPHVLPDAAFKVPVMCNFGTKEGFSVTDGRFAGVWPSNQTFFQSLRRRGGLIAVAVDPLTSHECGNQRYLAIPWLDACLSARLPATIREPLLSMNESDAWLAPLPLPSTINRLVEPVAAAEYTGPRETSIWLPSRAIANAWTQYVRDTSVADTTPPPSPTNVRLVGEYLQWDCRADLQSGISHFLIEQNGAKPIETYGAQNPFGRRVFQGLQYSDTPVNPLVSMAYRLEKPGSIDLSRFRVRAVNTAGLVSD